MAGCRPLVLSGPSGCGKSTLIKMLMKDYPGKFGFSVSHTTRQPRPGEENGRDYHFTTKESMSMAIKSNEFIEHAEFSGNMYGTSKQAVADVFAKGQTCILDIDMQGVQNVKKTNLNAVLVFLKPPTITELERRLRDRGTETEDSIQKRLTTSKREFEYADQPGSYDHVVVNDDLQTAYKDLCDIIHKVFHTKPYSITALDSMQMLIGASVWS